MESNNQEKNETNNNAGYEDEYVEEVYDYSIRGNTKKDQGAVRFKKVPFHKITLDTECPEEPQEKHDKPNDSHYQKELDKINKEIEKHNKNKDDLIEKIRQERTGNRPETKEYFDKVKDLTAKIEKIHKEIDLVEGESKGPISEEKKLKEKRERLEKEIDVKNYDSLMQEVRHYQEQLGFGTLSAQEEKKIMDKKNRLESQASSTKAYQQVKEQLKKLKESNKGLFDKLKVLRDEKKKLYEERKTVSAKIDDLKKNITENNEVVNQLKKQVDSIKEENKKLNKKYRDLEYEWNDKWFKYEKYMEIVDYIKEFKKKQADIKKREEKLIKKEEKENKKNTTQSNVEINLLVTDDSTKTLECKKLIEYFRSLLPKSENTTNLNTTNTTSDVSEKIAEDLKKGNLEIFDREAKNSKQVLGIEGGNNGKNKKNKGPKVSKREQKSNATEMLLLSVGISSQIKEFGLIAPNKRDQIESFVKTLEGRLDELKAEALIAKSQPKNESSEDKKEVKTNLK